MSVCGRRIFGDLSQSGQWRFDRRYARALGGYSGEILLVGVNYDKDNRNKPHNCVIEKLVYGIDHK